MKYGLSIFFSVLFTLGMVRDTQSQNIKIDGYWGYPEFENGSLDELYPHGFSWDELSSVADFYRQIACEGGSIEEDKIREAFYNDKRISILRFGINEASEALTHEVLEDVNVDSLQYELYKFDNNEPQPSINGHRVYMSGHCNTGICSFSSHTCYVGGGVMIKASAKYFWIPLVKIDGDSKLQYFSYIKDNQLFVIQIYPHSFNHYDRISTGQKVINLEEFF
ncbi:hypothetical protein [Phaeocystidibacter marisrubri]|uniref:Uncharacterized protein n=1 Tax=Phaeocystidibacter marisrubri TaxID=1577780 RepID=A0A6L3ZDQ9_9FLAO|nr:hypothetical protein [Phaeocystidibacter marisrubri]KAB2815532.1 hypothetical protein F8C82_07460 [Phaeocystidibacter marisrubri]GGH64385.1 hypothetical protein GCM10011318_00360 [Phaeocystidibacter marisrubri]